MLRAKYPNIAILSPGDEDLLSPKLLIGGHIVEMSYEFVTVVDRSLNRIEPALRSSIQTIAVVDFESMRVDYEGEWPSPQAAGPQIMLPASLSNAELHAALPHEAAHTFWGALEERATHTPSNDTEAFDPQTLAMAQTVIKRFHLLKGIQDAWQRLHDSGEVEQASFPYVGKAAWDKLTFEDAIVGGFWSPYGASEPAEDFAEYVLERSGAAENDDDPCKQFDNAVMVDSRLAIPYAKLVLLAGIGAIGQDIFEACVGGYSIVPKDPGIEFLGSGIIRNGLSASYGRKGNGPWSYFVSGLLDRYKFYIAVRLFDEKIPAIGLHRLESVSEANVDTVLNRTHVGILGGSDEYALASRSGLLLVTEARDGAAQGAIFGLALQDDDGTPQGNYRLVPFKVGGE